MSETTVRKDVREIIGYGYLRVWLDKQDVSSEAIDFIIIAVEKELRKK